MRIDALDRRVVYLFVFLALAVPIIFGYTVPPARMKSAEKMYSAVDQAFEKNPEGIAVVFLDWGPNTIAENKPQTEVLIEHLLRTRRRFAVATLYNLAAPFLDSVPKGVVARLQKEKPDERWEYGVDWVNLGYRPGQDLFLQNFAKADDLALFLRKDAFGTALKDLPAFANIKTLRDVPLVGEMTGLYGFFDMYVQFLQVAGYSPTLVHGCTSITVPEAYIYLDSGQLSGLLEGIAGAAWYSEILREKNLDRAVDSALVINTGLGIAHVVIIFLVFFGNVAAFLVRRAV